MRRSKRRSSCRIGSTMLFIVIIAGVVFAYQSFKPKDNDKKITKLKTDIVYAKDFDGQSKPIEAETIVVEEPKTEPPTEQTISTTVGVESTVDYSVDISHRDLRQFESINTDQMNTWIDALSVHIPNSPFKGQGEVFIKASQESGLDPRYILAHAALESAWGTSYLARTKHNYFGIAAYDASPNSAYHMGSELEAGIVNGAKWIADNYTNKGQHTLHLMIYGAKRYASDSQWINKIANIMRKCTV